MKFRFAFNPKRAFHGTVQAGATPDDEKYGAAVISQGRPGPQFGPGRKTQARPIPTASPSVEEAAKAKRARKAQARIRQAFLAQQGLTKRRIR